MDKKKVNIKEDKKDLRKIKSKIYIIFLIFIICILFFIIKNSTKQSGEHIYSVSEIIGKTNTKRVLKIRDINGDIFYLPKGFKISDNESEQIVKEGIIIIDDTGDEQTDGSEFVWIPIDTKKDIFNVKEVMYRTVDYSLLKENNSTKEYLNIKNSISTYGGFYISRYEAGISEKMKEELYNSEYMKKQSIIRDTTEKFANSKYKPVSKKNATVWNFIKWGGTFEETASDNLSGNDKMNGAVKVARNMYNNSKTSVKSNLCYGYQWDAIMNFIDSNYYNNQCDNESVIVDSSDLGNYYGELSESASDQKYSHKNIFDLAGNVWEWTMCGYSDSCRVVRGGAYCTRGDNYSISSEKEFYPSDYFKEIGFRVALWIE